MENREAGVVQQLFKRLWETVYKKRASVFEEVTFGFMAEWKVYLNVQYYIESTARLVIFDCWGAVIFRYGLLVDALVLLDGSGLVYMLVTARTTVISCTVAGGEEESEVEAVKTWKNK